MIDTVKLTLRGGYKIMEYDFFTPTARGFFEHPYYSLNGKDSFSCVQNPAAWDTSYKPRLTLTRIKGRGYLPTLSVEFSAPKLVYGENLSELRDADFPKVLAMLQQTLEEMGVKVSPEVLAAASVGRVDYGKNIVLPEGTSCASVLRRLAKGSINRISANERFFKNGGEAVEYRCNSFKLIFYDKQKEMQKDKWNAMIAKDSKFYGKEILRYELQLKDTKAVRRKLSLKKDSELKFKELFSEATSKAILQHFCSEIRKSLPLEASRQILLERLSPKSKLTWFNAYVETFGAAAAKEKLLRETGDNRTYKKLITELDNLRKNLPPEPSPLDVITEALEVFEPII